MDDGILSGLRLQPEQREAACGTGDIAVLAGAGCGKTTTLVARYLYLLSCGVEPDEIVAVTFTERAGREMRARIRAALRGYIERGAAGEGPWLERYVALDGAPIGTIHSLCARLLRAHPAEAGLDPEFVVADEGQARLLASEAVERALIWATEQEAAIPCFELLGGPLGLRGILATLVARRLEAGPALALDGDEVRARWQEAPPAWLAAVLDGPAWRECLEELQASVPAEPGDALDTCRCSAIAAVVAARRALAAGDWEVALATLAEGIRRPGNVGSKRAWGEQAATVRSTLRALADLYRDQVQRYATRADRSLDEALIVAWPGLAAVFRQAVADYAALKAQRQALDFDDLESGALRLLRAQPEVAAYRQGRCKAILVDEFQDTNERQRQLLEALLGAPAGQASRLFVVGDAKQSIYRFRGADVTVLRSVEQEIRRAGGQVSVLGRSWRAHAPLVELLNELLAAVLGVVDDPMRPYVVPFAPLVAADAARVPRLRPPFLELHLGVAASAEEGRRGAAAALAGRLLRLHAEEGLAWHDVACLFRATTHCALYEEAFERASIPYVTVAGTGFYERPEVRDLLNALRALEHPGDDLAMAGLLRSPAVGLADASLYLLRWGPDGTPRSLWAALQGHLADLEPGEQARARRAAAVVAELHGQAGREPVAGVLKRFLDLTAYPAMLSLVPQSERAGRNVDKLLADAHKSGAVSVGDFLAYVQALRDSGAREGEAPPEAGAAVQLLSVHRAKGLEFGVVVIADAGHDDAGRVPAALVHPEWGLVLRVTRADGAERREGLLHALARGREEEMQDAEERRLLYVAATRAREKLLVSGHAKPGKEGLTFGGWLRRLAAALGEEGWAGAPLPEPGGHSACALWEGRASCTLYAGVPQAAEPAAAQREAAAPAPAAFAAPLAGQVACPAGRAPGAGETAGRVWRVVPRRRGLRAPSWLVGKLVHVGLRLWRFPGEPGLEEALQADARSAGLTDERQVASAVGEAQTLLARFRRSDLSRELEAGERRHEVPYALNPEGPWGRIDLLSLRPDGSWWLLDFKTDELRSEAAREAKVAEHSPQLRRYGGAVARLAGRSPRLLLCFLDDRGAVTVREVASQAR